MVMLLWGKSTLAIALPVNDAAGRLPLPNVPVVPVEVDTIGIIAGNGPLPIPVGMKTPVDIVSDFPFLVTTTVSLPLVAGATAGT